MSKKIHLVLIRHGQSQWNEKNLFTGWTDIDLSQKGREEAKKAGLFLKEKGLTFDCAFTSVLKRAIRTLWIILDEMDLMWIPVTKTWRLNERHYGALQGKNKNLIMEEYGKDQLQKWRRDFSTKPPPLENHQTLSPKIYKDLTLPYGESLKDTQERFLPFWNRKIQPKLQEGSSVLITAHGNSLRALVKHLESVSDNEIAHLNIPTGEPLIYSVDSKGAIVKRIND